MEHHLSFPFVYLGDGEPTPPLPRSGPLIIDEAQRLPRKIRSDLFASLSQLVLSSHEDLQGDLEKAGWVVRTDVLRGLCSETLKEILDRRLEWARRDRGPIPQISLEQCRGLIGRFGDDVRAILAHLYNDFQNQADNLTSPTFPNQLAPSNPTPRPFSLEDQHGEV